MKCLFSFIVAFAMVMEIVGSKEEVGAVTKSSALEETDNNVYYRVDFSGPLCLLGLLPHLAGQPHQHPLCRRRGKNFTFFWSFFNPGFFFKVAASFVAWLFPNWRDLELAVGLVFVRITFVIGEVIIGID